CRAAAAKGSNRPIRNRRPRAAEIKKWNGARIAQFRSNRAVALGHAAAVNDHGRGRRYRAERRIAADRGPLLGLQAVGHGQFAPRARASLAVRGRMDQRQPVALAVAVHRDRRGPLRDAGAIARHRTQERIETDQKDGERNDRERAHDARIEAENNEPGHRSISENAGTIVATITRVCVTPKAPRTDTTPTPQRCEWRRGSLRFNIFTGS